MSEAITISNDKPESKHFTYDDMQAVIKRGGKGIPTHKPYDPKLFWESMGARFYKAFDKPEKCAFGVEFLIDRLREFQPVQSVLEVGCGFGRIAPFLLQAKVTETYQGVDISPEILKCSKDYLEPEITENKDIDNITAFFSNGSVSDITKGAIGKDVNEILDKIKKLSADKVKRKPVDYRDKITLVEGDAKKLTFDSESFDVVLSNETLQHLAPNDCYEACREMARVSKKAVILLERWAFPGEHSEPHIWSHNYNHIFSELGLDVVQVTTIAQGLQGVLVRKR